jgi:4-amino-4-deoxychorismate lyase
VDVIDAFPADDRGLTYGDGLFETMRAVAGTIPLLEHHLDRLLTGCRRIYLEGVDRDDARAHIESTAANLDDGVVRLVVTRGSGGRGYRPPTDAAPRMNVSVHPLAAFPRENYTDGVDVALCRTRIGNSPDTAGLKHLGRLEQVLASRELTDDIAEGLMMDHMGRVIEGTRSNLFVVENGALATPRLDNSGVAGIVRSLVLLESAGMGVEATETSICPERLASTDEIFLTNSVFGIWPVRSVSSAGWRRERGPVTTAIMERIARLGVEAWAP